jgi:hypothetical protein
MTRKAKDRTTRRAVVKGGVTTGDEALIALAKAERASDRRYCRAADRRANAEDDACKAGLYHIGSPSMVAVLEPYDKELESASDEQHRLKRAIVRTPARGYAGLAVKVNLLAIDAREGYFNDPLARSALRDAKRLAASTGGHGADQLTTSTHPHQN